MDQGCRIPCPECRILHPGQAGCRRCGGTGEVFQPARMADESLVREFAETTRRAVLAGGRSTEALRGALLEVLVYGEVYAQAYGGCPAEELVARLRGEILSSSR